MPIIERILAKTAKNRLKNESWGDSKDDDDDRKSDDERTESDDDKSVDLNKTDNEEESQGDEFVHTPDNYVPTDDETQDVDEEEYVRINKELYDDVNVEMKDAAEPADEGKGDEKMTDAEKVDVEHEEINQDVVSAQVQDEVQTTTTAAPTTQKEKVDVPLSSSSLSVSSNYDIIPEPAVIKPSDIVTTTPAITILPFTHLFISTSQQSTPSPIPTTSTITTTEDPTSTSEVKELKQVDLSTTLRTSIRSEVPPAVNEYLGSSLGDALQKEL
ncbi:hypothetical protein Tco_0887229 [Tanacetum coccineum]